MTPERAKELLERTDDQPRNANQQVSFWLTGAINHITVGELRELLSLAQGQACGDKALEFVRNMAARQTCEEDTRTELEGHGWDSGPYCTSHDWRADQDTIDARKFLKDTPECGGKVVVSQPAR